jgi:hypothetical protein
MLFRHGSTRETRMRSDFFHQGLIRVRPRRSVARKDGSVFNDDPEIVGIDSTLFLPRSTRIESVFDDGSIRVSPR